jgi:hypothetical protein
VTGSGFPPGAPLVTELFSDPVQLGNTVADASGRFRIVVTVPLGTPAGLHTLRVRGIDGTPFADTSLLVTAPALRGAPTATLSRTGANFTRRAGLAFVLMVAGFVLVALAWNDQRPAGIAGRRSSWPDRRRRP